MTLRFDSADPSMLTYLLRPGMAFVGSAPIGQALSFATMDSSGNQVTEEVGYDDLDPTRFFPVVGPIEIEGVRAGDAVGVEIRSIAPSAHAHTWTRPGLGLRPQPAFHSRRLATDTLRLDWAAGEGAMVDEVVATGRPHVGALGLLPDHQIEPRSLGRHGGNIDSIRVEPGATLWLTARQDGGGLFIGDIHAAMGDAEVCGTGAEAPAEVELVIHRRHGWSPSLPTIVGSDGSVSVIGTGDTVEEALDEAVEHVVDAFSRHQGIPPGDASLAVGLLLSVSLCQVVNPRRSVEVSLREGLDVVLGPEGTA